MEDKARHPDAPDPRNSGPYQQAPLDERKGGSLPHGYGPPTRTTTGRGPDLAKLAIGLLALAAIAIASIIFLTRSQTTATGRDLLSLIPHTRQDIGTFIETRSPEQTGTLLQQQTGWRVAIPGIDNTTLSGMAFSQVQSGISIPVLVYDEGDQTDIYVSVVTYAFLDTHRDLLSIDRDLLESLESENALVLPGSYPDLVLWRKGDEIFIATSGTDRESFAARLHP